MNLLQSRIRFLANPRTYYVTVVVLVLMPRVGHGLDLTLEQCLQRANTSSVEIARAVANEAKSEAAKNEAYSPRLPQLVAEGDLYGSNDIPGQASDANKGVLRLEEGTLPFGSAWKLGNQREAELQVAKEAKIETEQDVELLTKQIYFSILQDQDQIENIDSVKKELKRLSDSVIPRFQIGRAPSFDLVKVKSNIYDFDRSRDILVSQLAKDKSELAQLIGMDNTDFTLQPLTEVPPMPSVEQNLSNLRTDIEMNPTLVGLSKKVLAADAKIATAKSSRLPTLSASFEYGTAGMTPDSAAEWTAGMLQLRMPLFDWGLISSQIDQARAEKNYAQKQKDAIEQKVTTDLVQAAALAKAHLADYQRLKNLLPQLKRTSAISIARYKKSAINIIEATDAVNLWMQNLDNERIAYYSYLGDLANIERLTGGKKATKIGGDN